MIRHSERVAKVTEYRTVDHGEWVSIEVDYETEGGVTKTLVMPHCVADAIRVAIVAEVESMTDERRKQSFFASLRRKR